MCTCLLVFGASPTINLDHVDDVGHVSQATTKLQPVGTGYSTSGYVPL